MYQSVKIVYGYCMYIQLKNQFCYRYRYRQTTSSQLALLLQRTIQNAIIVCPVQMCHTIRRHVPVLFKVVDCMLTAILNTSQVLIQNIIIPQQMFYSINIDNYQLILKLIFSSFIIFFINQPVRIYSKTLFFYIFLCTFRSAKINIKLTLTKKRHKRTQQNAAYILNSTIQIAKYLYV